MRDDLIDAYAAIDWAKSYIPTIQKEFATWFEGPPYLVVTESHPETWQKLFKLEINRRLPPIINAGVGAVINSIRSSLDILATSLAYRNGKKASSDRYFPFYASIQDFIDPLSVAERKKWLSERERAIIESYRPYSGGDDVLFALHKLDIMRKHHKLIRVQLTPSGVTFSPESNALHIHWPAVWPGFQDGAVIAWTRIDAPECDFEISTYVAFDEAWLGMDRPVFETLNTFCGFANEIVQRFETT